MDTLFPSLPPSCTSCTLLGQQLLCLENIGDVELMTVLPWMRNKVTVLA